MSALPTGDRVSESHPMPDEAPLPVAIRLLIAGLTFFTVLGAALWTVWLAAATPDELTNAAWFFLCHLSAPSR